MFRRPQDVRCGRRKLRLIDLLSLSPALCFSFVQLRKSGVQKNFGAPCSISTRGFHLLSGTTRGFHLLSGTGGGMVLRWSRRGGFVFAPLRFKVGGSGRLNQV